MRICLIDADSVIPNLALMKLSTYYKNLNYSVDLVQVKLPYYPNRKKYKFNVPEGYDVYYCSIVFEGNKDYIIGDNIIFGGTGYDIKVKLPDEIEYLEPDYSIYPDNDVSYGFISRGCIRKCKFCVVPSKEGSIHQVSSINNIIRHKKVKFLDNNILALHNHKSILKELISKNIKCCFNQGLDIRLIDDENSKLLSQLNYMGEYVFAFDDWLYLSVINQKIKLLSWRKPWQLKFFVYCNPDMDLNNIIKRVEWLRQHECLPYVMRDIDCWKSKYNKFYVDLASYTNQPNFFKKKTFSDFLEKRYKYNSIKNADRIKTNVKLYMENK
jgi:hypothetical protein